MVSYSYPYPYPYPYRPAPVPSVQSMYMDYPRFLKDLLKAVEGEREAILFYETLEKMAPTDFARKAVDHALRDERHHNEWLTELYVRLTGKQPQVSVKPPKISGFVSGLDQAFLAELDASELYRNMYLNSRDSQVRDLLFDIMNDEVEHAIRFSYVRAMVK